MEDSVQITPMKISLRPTEAAIRKLEQQMALVEKRILALAPHPAIVLADATTGLSREKLAVVFAMLGDKHFSNRDQLTAFVGLDVAPRQSGTWRGKGKLSKRVNAYMRKVLFQIAWGLKQHNLRYRLCYERLRAAGKNYVTAMLVLARKFRRFLYAYYWKSGFIHIISMDAGL
jgi:transposase